MSFSLSGPFKSGFVSTGGSEEGMMMISVQGVWFQPGANVPLWTQGTVGPPAISSLGGQSKVGQLLNPGEARLNRKLV